MFCSSCGKQIPDGSTFCPICGAKLQAAGGGQQQYASAPQQPNYGSPLTGGAIVSPNQPTGPGYIQTDRSILVYIILSFITCGIYGFWFIYTIARDMNVMCSGDGDRTPGLGAYIGLSIVTCGIYNLWWVYKIGNRLAYNAPRYGLQFQENGTTVLMWYIVGIILCGLGPWIGMYIIIKNTNAMAAAYNNYMARQ